MFVIKLKCVHHHFSHHKDKLDMKNQIIQLVLLISKQLPNLILNNWLNIEEMLELMFHQENHLLSKKNHHLYLLHGVKQKKLYSNNIFFIHFREQL